MPLRDSFGLTQRRMTSTRSSRGRARLRRSSTIRVSSHAVTVVVSTTVLATISPFAATLLAGGTAVIVAAETHVSRRQRLLAADIARGRAAARAQLIAAMAAADELVSLGAVAEVRSTVADLIASAALKRSAADRFDRCAVAAIAVAEAVTTINVALTVLMTPGISLPRATLILLMTIATVDLLRTRNLAGAAHRVVDVGMHRTE